MYTNKKGEKNTGQTWAAFGDSSLSSGERAAFCLASLAASCRRTKRETKVLRTHSIRRHSLLNMSAAEKALCWRTESNESSTETEQAGFFHVRIITKTRGGGGGKEMPPFRYKDGLSLSLFKWAHTQRRSSFNQCSRAVWCCAVMKWNFISPTIRFIARENSLPTKTL